MPSFEDVGFDPENPNSAELIKYSYRNFFVETLG